MDADEALYYGGPTLTEGKPAPQTGKIYDRYRMRVNKGLLYAHLNCKGLTLTAEALLHYGYNYYDYSAPAGENEFYGDFYITGDSTIKGGYYAGTPVNFSKTDIFSMAQKRYPDSFPIRNTYTKAAMNVYDGG